MAQILSAAIVQYMRDMGVDTALFSLMSRAGASEIVTLNEIEMVQFHVVNGGVQPTQWTLESLRGIVYLKGQRDTWRGVNKFILVCTPNRQILLHVIYDPEGRGDEIIKLLKVHSLFINDHRIPLGNQQVGSSVLVNGWINAEYLLSENLLRRIQTARTPEVTGGL